MSKLVAGFSGGKDSTAMVLEMARRGEEFEMIFTPAGNEPPELLDHITNVSSLVGMPLRTLPCQSLYDLIAMFKALPNWRMRWCTRMIKIRPCIDYLLARPGSTLCVGLRADEEEREGLYGDYATYRYPLREWDMDIADVRRICRDADGVEVPTRTDCMLCYGQRISEWYHLWRDRPEAWREGEELEERYGHTFRSAGRDSWPAALADLRAWFERGHVPRGAKPAKTIQLPIWEEPEEDDEYERPCRVCRL